MGKDYIILIHEYGYKHLGIPVKEIDIIAYLTEHGIDTNDSNILSGVQSVIHDSFVVGRFKNIAVRYFKSEAYYRYLEYLELVEARKNSKQANRNAVIAIAISVVLAAIQIVTAR